MMIDLADEIQLAFASPGGNLEELLVGAEKRVYKIV